MHCGILINITNLKFNIIRAAWSLAADATTAKACDSEYNLSASIHHLNLRIATPAFTVTRKHERKELSQNLQKLKVLVTKCMQFNSRTQIYQCSTM